MPDECEQQDDRQRHAQQEQKNSPAHYPVLPVLLVGTGTAAPVVRVPVSLVGPLAAAICRRARRASAGGQAGRATISAATIACGRLSRSEYGMGVHKHHLLGSCSRSSWPRRLRDAARGALPASAPTAPQRRAKAWRIGPRHSMPPPARRSYWRPFPAKAMRDGYVEPDVGCPRRRSGRERSGERPVRCVRRAGGLRRAPDRRPLRDRPRQAPADRRAWQSAARRRP